MIRIDRKEGVVRRTADGEEAGVAPSDVTGDSSPDSVASRGLLVTHQRFDEVAAERAEILREGEVLRTMAMTQIKDDDAYLAKWIALIG
ncbi:MAG: hypothetical protein ACYDA5_01845 [Vulcanimicrobiaceae bacterium]